MSEVTLDGNPPASALDGTEVIAMVQNGSDVSGAINLIVSLVNAIAQLADISQVSGLVTELANKLNLSGGTLTGSLNLAANAANPLEPVTYQQFLGAIAGFAPKSPSRFASTANLVATYNNGASGVGATLTMNSVGAMSFDGGTPNVGDQIFVGQQTNQTQNGFYIVTVVGNGSTAGVLTRATNYDTPSEVFQGTYTEITEGATYAGTFWYLTTSGTITLGTSNLIFARAGASIPGAGLTLSAPNTIAIADTAVTPGAYSDASKTINATVNSRGQLTALALVAIAIAASQVTDFNTAVATTALSKSNNLSDVASPQTTRSNLKLAGFGVNGNTGVNATLTNPLNRFYQIQMDVAGLSVTLPAMNASNSLLPGESIIIYNTFGGLEKFDVKANDGSIVVSQLARGAFAIITLIDNSTAAGGFRINRSDNALQVINNLSDLQSPAVARNNIGFGSYFSNSNSSVSVTLTNPPSRFNAITLNSAGLSCTLPPMNLASSLQVGEFMVIENSGSQPFDLKYNSGAGLFTQIPAGSFLILFLVNPTSDGVFRPFRLLAANNNLNDVGNKTTVLSNLNITGTHAIPYISVTNAITNGASYVQLNESTTNKNNGCAWQFAASGNNYLHIWAPMPKSWSNTTTFGIILYWMTPGTSGNCVWNVQAVIRNDNSAYDLAFGSAASVTSAAKASANNMIVATIATITPAGTGANNSIIEFRINRNGGAGSDTLASVANLVGWQLLMTTNAGNDA